MDFIVTILYLCLTLFLQCGAPMEHRLSKRLIGSEEVRNLNDFPYIVSIQFSDHLHHFCAGVILSEYWVLAVAHCVDRKNITVVVKVVDGDIERGSSHPVDKMIIHQNFSQTTEHAANDIAALHVNQSLFRHNRNAKAITAIGRIADKSGIRVQTVGWGYPKDMGSVRTYHIFNARRLRKLSLQTMDSGHCRKIHDKAKNVVDNNHICASGGLGKSPCNGDAGNPLITLDKKRLVGIFSGYETCLGDFPALFVRLSGYVDWLRKVTGLKLPLY